jgi:hypothetical protein
MEAACFPASLSNAQPYEMTTQGLGLGIDVPPTLLARADEVIE